MRNTIWRMFSLFMAIILVIGMVPATAFADEGIPGNESEGTAEGAEADPLEEIEIESIWAEIEASLPPAFYDPSNGGNPYPKGYPVDNFFPAEFYLDPALLPVPFTLESNYSAGMWDNTVLDAMQYLGYDVQWLKNNGVLYDYRYMGSRLQANAPGVLTDIGYSGAIWVNGDDTIADSSTVTGRAPNVGRFEQNGLCCASFLAYYYCNYLPNIAGVDTKFIYDVVKEEGWDSVNNRYDLTSVSTWDRAMDRLVETAGSGVTRYPATSENWKYLQPGDYILFESDYEPGTWAHVAIYLGTGPMDNGGYTYAAVASAVAAHTGVLAADGFSSVKISWLPFIRASSSSEASYPSFSSRPYRISRQSLALYAVS